MGDWIRVANALDMESGQATCVTVHNQMIALFNIDGKLYAIDDECPHAGASLAEGSVQGTEVTCPWHHATFDLAEGTCLEGPSPTGVQCYPVKIENGEVFIELP
ncbi:MAG: Rieske (2Fe-2S) protein [bacterium]|jgi:NAD(P)H-dependent nitrite reductase small subunit